MFTLAFSYFFLLLSLHDGDFEGRLRTVEAHGDHVYGKGYISRKGAVVSVLGYDKNLLNLSANHSYRGKLSFSH